MKRAISILLVLILTMSLCACAVSTSNIGGGSASSPATITDLSGNTVKLTAAELCAIYNDNAAKFNNLYDGATITAVGTVERISNVREAYGDKYAMVYKITMKEGWELTVLEKGHDEVINLSGGDKIQFKSCIKSCGFGSVSMYDIDGYPPSEDYSTIKVVN